MKYGTVGAAAVVEEELPSPKLKKLLVNSFGGAGRAPETNMKSIKSHSCLASVAHAVIQAIGRTELEDGTRTGVRLKWLHAEWTENSLSPIHVSKKKKKWTNRRTNSWNQ